MSSTGSFPSAQSYDIASFIARKQRIRQRMAQRRAGLDEQSPSVVYWLVYLASGLGFAIMCVVAMFG